MNPQGIGRLDILLGMEPRIQAEYTIVKNAKTFWEQRAAAYKSKLKLNIFQSTEEFLSMKVHNCRDDDNDESQIDRDVKDDNLCTG